MSESNPTQEAYLRENAAKFAVKYYEDPHAEKKEKSADIWANSDIVVEQRKNLEAGDHVRIALLDIDSTLYAGDPQATQEAADALKAQGFSVVLLTARPTEMQMKSYTYLQSRVQGGLDRPVFRQKTIPGENDTQKAVYEIPELRPDMPEGMMDPVIMGGANGTQLAVKNGEKYMMDTSIYAPELATPDIWRQQTTASIQMINEKARARGIVGDLVEFSAIDPVDKTDNRYQKREILHKPHDYKIELKVRQAQDKQLLRELIAEMQSEASTGSSVKEQLAALDIIDDSNPDKVRKVESGVPIPDLTLHVVPKDMGKEFAGDHVIDNVARVLGVKREDMQVLIAGDSYHDVAMGLQTAKGADVSFIIPGGSRLYRYLTNQERDFGGEDLSPILDALQPADPPLTEDGARHYRYQDGKETRNVFLYPPELKGPQAITAATARYNKAS